MTNTTTPRTERELLEMTLEIYGADRTRWPVQRRHELSQFIAASAEAQKLIADAAAFDRLLDSAPTVDIDRQKDLFARIMSEVERAPRVVIDQAPLVRLPVNTRQPQWRRWGGAGAALAASLMLGVIAGQSASFSTAAEDFVAMAGFDTGTASQQVAQSDDSGGYFEEDLL